MMMVPAVSLKVPTRAGDEFMDHDSHREGSPMRILLAIAFLILAAGGVLGRPGEKRPPLPQQPAAPVHWWKQQPDVLMTTPFLMAQEVDPDDPHKKQDEMPVALPRRELTPAPGPSIFASTVWGVIFFVAGAIGWVALSVSVLILERRHATNARQ